ncbi:hypothetical protein LLEC1_07357 [Akanthomyces lecanii]|uniref:Heterokaryon incompatibility domain-containing protein n=1 Tax=Cordyceps confragosa TaxID=2714763 RepID=A0A179IBT9_CORDF|nr:hypothetical protein LLEC1_07357 [Akanthomyces lecanii]
MRLINANTLDIEEFFGDDVPGYAILSHTWGPEEVTLQEWPRRQEPTISSKSGYQKILSACRLANAHHLSYVWVDTNCIDKTSSAELSEAINSMFDWYSDAQVCLVHLEDVALDPEKEAARAPGPEFLHFYDREWTHMTDKKLCLDALSFVTSIPTEVLESQRNIRGASTAQRMSWLSRRKTTRREDMAYCMFGIFGVNLPLLYGEGDRAFTRLQEELIRSYYDQTVFCWSWPELVVRPEWPSVLAPCAAAFADSGKYIQRPGAGIGKLLAEYSVTNVGIRIQLPVLCSSPMTYYAILDVQVEGMAASTCVAIPLLRPGTMWISETVFWRAQCPDGPLTLPHSWAGPSLSVRLAKPGTEPADHGYSDYALALLPEQGSDSWPRIPHSKFAVLLLESVGAGAPTQPLCTRRLRDGGVEFLQRIAPTVWCCTLRLLENDKARRPCGVTVVLRENQKPGWSVTRATIAEIRGGTAKAYNQDGLCVTIADSLELPRRIQGPISDVGIFPLFIKHTHHYKGEQ